MISRIAPARRAAPRPHVHDATELHAGGSAQVAERDPRRLGGTRLVQVTDEDRRGEGAWRGSVLRLEELTHQHPGAARILLEAAVEDVGLVREQGAGVLVQLGAHQARLEQLGEQGREREDDQEHREDLRQQRQPVRRQRRDAFAPPARCGHRARLPLPATARRSAVRPRGHP
jgi:hypothetical protein